LRVTNAPDSHKIGNLSKEATHFMPVFTLTDAQARARAQHSPASERNRQPILDLLQRVLPSSGTALEIASGTGQHVAFFAAAMQQWTWQPSDLSGGAFDSIAAWCVQEGVANVRAPVVLDVTAPRWPADGPEFAPHSIDAIYCANMLHIAPWAACGGLMQGASRYLKPGGLLVTYGPYLEQEVTTSQGNLDFDISLRQRNSAWGIRALEDVAQEASKAGLRLAQRFAMPANNLLLVWARE
jgi:SAM-dependent methyltransferase